MTDRIILIGKGRVLLDGTLVPLPFFPDPIRKIAQVLPFASMQNVPFRIYGGDLCGREAWQMLLMQGIWLLLLVTLGKLLMMLASRRLWCREDEKMKHRQREQVSYFRLYRKYIQIQLQSMMQYKTSFFLTAFGQFLTAFGVFLGVSFLFQRFQQVAGFTYGQVLLCFSLNLLEFSLAKIDLTRIGRMIQAMGILVYGLGKSQVDWNFAKMLTVVFMLVGGTAVYAGIFLIYASVSFFTIEGLESLNIFTYGAREAGKYPISIYGEGVLKFCTFVIPYAWMQYYPLCYLLERNSRSWYLLLPLGAIGFLLPCYGLWRFGVHHYKSTGS